MEYVGRDGKPITREEAYAIYEGDFDENRRVGRDEVNGHEVSTVYLVLDHGFGDVVIPFETMIFSKHDGDCELDQWQDRYPTEEAARAGHEQACALARDASCGGGA